MPAVLRVVARAVTQRFAAVLDRVEVPLTLVQLRGLYALLDEPDGVALKHWARKIEMSDSSASRLGQRLERDGLIDRQAGAGRALSVVITESGREALTAIESEQSRELYRMTEPLGPDDRQELITLIEQLVDLEQDPSTRQEEPW